MDKKKNILFALAVFVVAVGVLVTVADYLQTISYSDLPAWFQPILVSLVRLVESSPGLVIIAYLRNLTGLLSNYLKKEPGSGSYELTKLRDTIAKYFALGGPFLAAVPTPYNQVGIAIAFIVDVLMSQFNKVINPVDVQSTAAKTGAGPP
ncbi:hypothetical protein MUO79_00920 [Candidatus Bathyarchaeota archaeon]|nr:hypothetical protein [Candidatus Bathyarchaeota archaeon]